MTTHPKVLTETFAVYDHSPTGQALRTWQELYPDGSLRSFREIWTTTTGASGTVYGGVQVEEVKVDTPRFKGGAGEYQVWHHGKNDYRVTRKGSSDVLRSFTQFNPAFVFATHLYDLDRLPATSRI